MKSFFKAIALSAFVALVACGGGDAPRSDDAGKDKTTMKTTPEQSARTGYAHVNGLKMYYEIQGDGRPLVLLHGGITTIGYSFGKIRPSLAKTWKTIAIEQQAHGHTGDIDRPLTYEQMTEDTAGILRHLQIEKADFFGWSDGGAIALRIAAKHPDLVRKVAVFGTSYNPDGETPATKQLLQKLKADDEGLAEFREGYARVAPEPKNWPVLIDKVKRMAREFKGWPPGDIKAIKAPVMVMVGDADIIRPEHAVELFRLLAHGQLAVLPVSDHFAPVQRPDWVISMLEAFLNPPIPETK
jgi:pimeloyl-ACP methyl ester carboxylesterase